MLLGLCIGLGGAYVKEKLFSDRPLVIATQALNGKTLKIYGEISRDNWCFVKYAAIYNNNENGAVDYLLPTNNHYAEHCPDDAKTPWFKVTEEGAASLQILTGIINGTRYDAYRLSGKSERYELLREP